MAVGSWPSPSGCPRLAARWRSGSDGSRSVRLLGTHTAPGVDGSDSECVAVRQRLQWSCRFPFAMRGVVYEDFLVKLPEPPRVVVHYDRFGPVKLARTVREPILPTSALVVVPQLGHWPKLAGYLLASAAHSRRDGVPAAMGPDLLGPNTRHRESPCTVGPSTQLTTLYQITVPLVSR